MRNTTAIFNGLSIFVLMAAFFLIQPSHTPAVAALQTSMEQQVGVAFQQVLGDQPYFSVFGDIYDGLTAFYSQSTDATIALLTQPSSDQALYEVARNTFGVFAHAMSKPQTKLAQAPVVMPAAGKFMTEAAIDNIVPAAFGTVSGAAITADRAQPVNQPNQWVTVQDNFTGQEYCLAIYNGEVNKYLGACKNDYH